MRRLIYTRSARRDLLSILNYIAHESASSALGRRFTDQIQQQCRKLASLPGLMGRPRPELRPDLRSFAFRGYIILFRYEGDTMEIVNIIEGHRDIDDFFSSGR